jgi:arsenical pump membrane protein
LVARIAPVLVFLIAVTVIAELADKAKVFDVAAREAAHLARGRVWRLWLLVVVLATVLTIVLSLDTCAVLLTPVVLAMARQLDVPPKLSRSPRSGWPVRRRSCCRCRISPTCWRCISSATWTRTT